MLAIIAWLQHYWIVPVTGVFVLILVTTYWPGRRAAIERNGRIPLYDDPQGAPRRAD
jgi:cbb3-type cytochrome oxidase subunit 3